MRISELENASYSSVDVDPRSGNYCVSIVDGDRFNLLLGPFNNHQDALDKVNAVRDKAMEINRTEAVFAGFGTVRLEDYNKPGLFNKYIL